MKYNAEINETIGPITNWKQKIEKTTFLVPLRLIN